MFSNYLGPLGLHLSTFSHTFKRKMNELRTGRYTLTQMLSFFIKKKKLCSSEVKGLNAVCDCMPGNYSKVTFFTTKYKCKQEEK